MVAALASASLFVAACAGASTPSPSPASAPTAAPAAVAVDPCLVGTWTTVAKFENSPANDENITYTGGAGEVFTIAADGAVTIETSAAEPVVFVSAGDTFTAKVAGTGHGTLSTRPAGSTQVFDFKPSADDTRTTLSLDSTGTPLGPARPDTPFTAVYTCNPGAFEFYDIAVNYMIDGPIIKLTPGVGTPSPSSSPAKS